MNRSLNKGRNNTIKIVLSIIFVFLLVVGIFNTISSYEVLNVAHVLDGRIKARSGEYVSVIFDADGGDLDFNEKRVKAGEKIGDLPKPTKDGYLFSNWFLDSEDNRIISNSIVNGTGSIILKAKYLDLNNIALLKENAFFSLTDLKDSVE